MIRCGNILTLVTNLNMFLYCMVLEGQERARLLSNSWKTPKPTNGMILFKSQEYILNCYIYTNFSFSDIFYIDATNQQTLEADLMTITPTYIEESVDACLRWLASQSKQNWLLFFDNADDVQLDLTAFFPACRFGNILVTTRNPHLSIHAGEDGDAKVTGMDPEDAKYLLLSMSRSEKNDENEKLAKLIVKVLVMIFLFNNYFQANRGYRSSIILHWLSLKLQVSFIAAHHSRTI